MNKVGIHDPVLRGQGDRQTEIMSKLFFIIECQLTNIEGMVELENLATLMVVMNSAKKHQWRLKLV